VICCTAVAIAAVIAVPSLAEKYQEVLDAQVDIAVPIDVA
jgi:hypothetical protein